MSTDYRTDYRIMEEADGRFSAVDRYSGIEVLGGFRTEAGIRDLLKRLVRRTP